MTRIAFKNCSLDVYPESKYCETVFPNGGKVPAAPHDTQEYIDSAKAHGYDSTFLFCMHHEMLHTVIAELRGLPFSPVLKSLADGAPPPVNWAEEEQAIMYAQRRIMEVSRLAGLR